MSKLMVYSDGGARGNPGLAAVAFMILSEKGEPLSANSRYVGVRTNNQAEYEALIAALDFARTLTADEVICHLDSELVAKQLTGEYAIKNPALKKLWTRVQEQRKSFKKVSFKNVPRTNECIKNVDKLVNETLDAMT